MPIAPYMCIGGFDVDDSGKIWLSDSVNRKIKSFHNKQWRYAMVSSEKIGEVDIHKNKLYIISLNPNGYLIFDCESEKVENLIRVPFKTPGRILCLNENLLLIEEISGGGIWIIENGKAQKHPAVALEACATGDAVYGLQQNFDSEARSIIRAPLAKTLQEPDVIANLEAEPGNRFIFSKMAGMIKNNPVTMSINGNTPMQLDFNRLNNSEGTFSKISLPLLEGPYLLSSWKLCSNGEFYGFYGTASEGYKIYHSRKNF